MSARLMLEVMMAIILVVTTSAATVLSEQLETCSGYMVQDSESRKVGADCINEGNSTASCVIRCDIRYPYVENQNECLTGIFYALEGDEQ